MPEALAPPTVPGAHGTKTPHDCLGLLWCGRAARRARPGAAVRQGVAAGLAPHVESPHTLHPNIADSASASARRPPARAMASSGVGVRPAARVPGQLSWQASRHAGENAPHTLHPHMPAAADPASAGARRRLLEWGRPPLPPPPPPPPPPCAVVARGFPPVTWRWGPVAAVHSPPPCVTRTLTASSPGSPSSGSAEGTTDKDGAGTLPPEKRKSGGSPPLGQAPEVAPPCHRHRRPRAH